MLFFLLPKDKKIANKNTQGGTPSTPAQEGIRHFKQKTGREGRRPLPHKMASATPNKQAGRDAVHSRTRWHPPLQTNRQGGTPSTPAQDGIRLSKQNRQGGTPSTPAQEGIRHSKQNRQGGTPSTPAQEGIRHSKQNRQGGMPSTPAPRVSPPWVEHGPTPFDLLREQERG